MPCPKDLAAYARVMPDLPEKILIMAEKNLDAIIFQQQETLRLKDKQLDAHNADLKNEQLTIEGDTSNKRLSLYLAFIIVIVAFVLALALALMGKDVLAGIVAGTTLAGIVASFLASGKSNSDDTDQPG